MALKKEWTVEQIREFVKKDYQSISARFVKCLLSHYDEDLLNILVYYQSRGDQYRNETELVNVVKDFLTNKQN